MNDIPGAPEVLSAFARALDDEDYTAAARCLAPGCRYSIAGETLTGPDAIVASYRENGDWVRATLDQVSYESAVSATGDRFGVITFTDHLRHAGRTHTHRCRQHVMLDDAGRIAVIVHEDLAGEKEAVDRFFAAAGIERKRKEPPADSSPPDLKAWLGDIDIYLFDQVQRGRFRPGMKILDAGAGGGRNLVWFLRAGYDVFAVDEDPAMVERLRERARRLAPQIPADNFRTANVTDLPFPTGTFDAVICIAVLHFAADEAGFDVMLDGLWRVLRPGGILFTRLASSIGLEDRLHPLGGRRYTLPDGTDRFVVDGAYLLRQTERIGGRLLDPIKTVNVQGMRCMTNWCLEKSR